MARSPRSPCCASWRPTSCACTGRTSTRPSGASRATASCSTPWAASGARSRRCAPATGGWSRRARRSRRPTPTPRRRASGPRCCARRPRSWCAPLSCRARRRRSGPSAPAWCTPSAWPCRRLAQLARLKRKFAGTVEDLIRRRDELMAEVDSVAGGGEAMVELEAAAEAARRAAAEWAGRLSVERRREARDLSRALVAELEALALTGARFEARFAESEGRALGPEGWDESEFFLSTNPGEAPRSLARVASGGELSRIMLALKTLAAADERGATLIFDEVDAGIGGAVAEVVGRKLRQLGRSRQVLCITHLPLIAAFADHHVVVTKKVEDGRTVSTARPLATSERVAELARMLGGERLTHEVREHAEQLLRRANGPQPGIDRHQRGRVAG